MGNCEYRPHYRVNAWVRGTGDDQQDDIERVITDALAAAGLGAQEVVVFRMHPISDYADG